MNALNLDRFPLLTLDDVNFDEIKEKTLSFVNQCRLEGTKFEYRYSLNQPRSNIYNSTYACMTLSLLGEMKNISEEDKKEWAAYFDGFQNDEGYFIDPILENELFDDTDWWGKRHLLPQLVIVYTALGQKPATNFKFLEQFYREKGMINWLEEQEWYNHNNDLDNKLMNIGVALQYERDTFGNKHAAKAIEIYKDWLLKERLNLNTGLFWPDENFEDPHLLSRITQYSYHIYPIFLYDGYKLPKQERIIDHVLKTQNEVGGYGVHLNSSACEDIDSVEPLYRFLKETDYRRDEVIASLTKALPWVVYNQNPDGGYVFKRNMPFKYGHDDMLTESNESSMFATWFRTLCLAYLFKALDRPNGFHLVKAPGYEFP